MWLEPKANFASGEIPSSVAFDNIKSEYHLTNYGTGIDYEHPIFVRYTPKHIPNEHPEAVDVTRFLKMTLWKKDSKGNYVQLNDKNFIIEYTHFKVIDVGEVNGFYICWHNKQASLNLDLKISAEYEGQTIVLMNLNCI